MGNNAAYLSDLFWRASDLLVGIHDLTVDTAEWTLMLPPHLTQSRVAKDTLS